MGAQPLPSPSESDSQIIRNKVKKLVRQNGFRRDDVPDLQQELSLQVSIGLAKYDPTRGTRNAFVARIIKNKVASINERETASKRDKRRERPLDEEHDVPDEDVEVDPAHLHLRLDITATIDQLPADLQPIARMLMTHSKVDAGSALGLTPQQLKTAIDKISRHFLEMGISKDF